jgi:hypothetical protein
MQAAVDNSPTVADILVDVGGQRTDSWNIFGHVSIAVTGGGIYSFGTGTVLGGSVADFVSSQADAKSDVVLPQDYARAGRPNSRVPVFAARQHRLFRQLRVSHFQRTACRRC